MDFYLLGLLVSAIGVSPLVLTKKWRTALVALALGFVVFGSIFYLTVPFTAWPWFGCYGVCTAVMLAISGLLTCLAKNSWGEYEPKFHPCLGFSGVALVMLLSMFSGCGLFRSSEYASLIGNVEPRVWTQDIQPKDPQHIRMASTENAIFLAKQAFGQAGSIGSQFEICESSATPQLINNKFRIVVPVDFRGFWEWNATGSIPGYVMVNSEDPKAEAQFVQLPEGKQFKYSPNACFGYNLERHIWRQGYRNHAITSYTLEVDDDGNPWWTVTLYKPACFIWGEVFAGVVLVNPVTGDCIKYEPTEIPSWVDLAVPSHFVVNWVNNRGTYANGYWNTVFGKKDLTQAEASVMVYGSDGQPYWVTDVTSQNAKDSSLIGLYYTNTRTGKSVYYKAEGSTHAAILSAVSKNSDVQFKKLHGTTPQIYNIHGTMASVVPLLNENHIFQGVAIVDVKNIQVMGVGNDQFEAIRQYERLLPLSGHQALPDNSRKIEKIKGTVERISLVPQGNEPIFYLLLKDVPRVLTAGTQLSPKLPLTRPGDEVFVEYYSSSSLIEPLRGFDNLSVRLGDLKKE